MGERLAQLTQLGELMKAGVLTEAEFQQQKARILNGRMRVSGIACSGRYRLTG